MLKLVIVIFSILSLSIIGSSYKKYPGGYWVAPNGLKTVVKHYLHKAQNMTHCSVNSLKRKLIRCHLVVIWVGNFDNFSNHAVILTGYRNRMFYYNDPWTGTKRKISLRNFMKHWRLNAYRALSY